METRSAKRKRQRLCFAADETLRIDMITDLPDAILHHILSYLPIKSIAQTSTLSKRWRTIWYSFPDLDFTTASAAGTVAAASIATVLSHRRNKNTTENNLRSLRFSASRLAFSALNSIIRLAVRHRVQNLDVEVSTNDFFNFPRSLISSETLRKFKLKSTSPGFRLLPSSIMSRGFQSLISLSLSLIKFTEHPYLTDLFTGNSFPCLKTLDLDKCHELKRLKVSCQGIERFSLSECYHLRELEICCRGLETLRVVSCFDAYSGGDKESTSVRIRNGGRIKAVEWEVNAVTGRCEVDELTAVKEAAIGFFMEYYEEISAVKIESVCSFLCGFSRADALTLGSQCIEILSNRKDSAHYSKNPLFSNVQLLELHTGFNKKNVSGLAFLFKSSPNLQTLVLKIHNDNKIERRQWNRDLWDASSSSEQEQYWESQVENLKPFLNSLKAVKIHGFLEYENEVSLAKFLLKHCKHLQEMTLSTPRHCNYRDSLRRQKVRSQMMGFSWASSNAKFSFL